MQTNQHIVSNVITHHYYMKYVIYKLFLSKGIILIKQNYLYFFQLVNTLLKLIIS